jgi:hypothetical protein
MVSSVQPSNTWTHADDVNREFVNFLGEGIGKGAGSAPQNEPVA